MFLEVPVKKRLALKPENRCFQPEKFEPIFQTSTSEPNLLDYITIIFSLSFGNSFNVASIGRYVMHFPLNYDVGTYYAPDQINFLLLRDPAMTCSMQLVWGSSNGY